jgi:hypothetical protein
MKRNHNLPPFATHFALTALPNTPAAVPAACIRATLCAGQRHGAQHVSAVLPRLGFISHPLRREKDAAPQSPIVRNPTLPTLSTP